MPSLNAFAMSLARRGSRRHHQRPRRRPTPRPRPQTHKRQHRQLHHHSTPVCRPRTATAIARRDLHHHRRATVRPAQASPHRAGTPSWITSSRETQRGCAVAALGASSQNLRTPTALPPANYGSRRVTIYPPPPPATVQLRATLVEERVRLQLGPVELRRNFYRGTWNLESNDF
jgi:hypothetical protein